jgi:prepilin-type N-terminal cleavage/methylation domain-containing protein
MKTRKGVNSMNKRGFTLMEIMIAIALMLIAITMVWMSFSQIIFATRKAEAMMDRLHHGDFVMEQLISAFRSASFFNNTPAKFEMWLEDESAGGVDADIVSIVTSSPAFIPPSNKLAHQLHRIFISIEDNDKGEPALAVSAYPYIVDLEDPEVDEVEPWIVTSKVIGLNCRVYNPSDQDWDDEWEFKNSIPQWVELTIYLKPLVEGEDPVAMTRMVEIPMGFLAKRQNRDLNVNNTGTDPTATTTDTNATGVNTSPNTGGTTNNRNTGNTSGGNTSNRSSVPATGGSSSPSLRVPR